MRMRRLVLVSALALLATGCSTGTTPVSGPSPTRGAGAVSPLSGATAVNGDAARPSSLAAAFRRGSSPQSKP